MISPPHFDISQPKISRLRESSARSRICFYMSNEGLSLLENAAHVGLPIPDKLKDILAQLHDKERDKGTTDQGDGE